MNNTSAVDRASRLRLVANQAASFDARPGSAVRCVGGKLWLTQEGDVRDHVVPAGTTFCADRAGRIVLTAIDGVSVALVGKAPAYCVPGTVTIDSVETFERSAKAAQAAYVAGLLARLVRWVMRHTVGRSASLPLRPGRTGEEKFHGFVRSL